MAEIINLDQVKAGVVIAPENPSKGDSPCEQTDYACTGQDQPCGTDWACATGSVDATCSVEDHACAGKIFFPPKPPDPAEPGGASAP